MINSIKWMPMMWDHSIHLTIKSTRVSTHHLYMCSVWPCKGVVRLKLSTLLGTSGP